MVVDIPTVEKCCCCFPLTHGIVLAGYLKIIASLFVVGVGAFYLLIYIGFYPYVIELFSPLLVVLTLVPILVDVIFTVILITGVLKKKISYLRLYCRYGIVWAVIIITEGILWIINEINTNPHGNPWKIYFTLPLLTTMIFTLHVYLVILTHSIIKKIESTPRTDL